MQLTLVRHAIAEDGEDDFARALTRRGRKRFTAVVDGLERVGTRFDQCLHSPRVRALETAELLAPLVDGALEVTPLLTEPPGPRLLELLRGQRVALVGHEPHLTALLAWLVVGRQEAGSLFALKKGGLAVLEGVAAPARMRLTALWTPRVFR